MTIFELVKLALDELYAEGKKEHGSKLDVEISGKVKYLAASYRDLDSESRSPIDYEDPATRFAYVFKYTASHGDYVVQTLQAARHALNDDVFSGGALRLSCIGGGPGSDVIGVLKYLSDHPSEPTKKITCYLLDGEQAWADTWTEIGDSIETTVSVSVHFQPLNVTDPGSWSAQKKFLQADIFTLSYFVSEVYAADQGVVAAFWQKLFDEARSGALFLYLDNGAEVFNSYFDSQWNGRSDIEALVKVDNAWMTPRYTEQASELGDYRTKFGQHPKLKSRVSYRILRKK